MLRKTIPWLLLLFLAVPPAQAQDQNININLFVNYGAAYRDGQWAPVDVLVDNTLKDVEGWVQVTTYDANGDVLSPIYRVAAESPRQSRKRFRLTCKLQGVNRIEAQLFDGNRPAGGPPIPMTISSIGKNDFMCLVLDDKPDAYGFLSTSLYPNTNIRFHREFLDTGRLGFLSDHLATYTPFDMIILGEIDPSRIGQQHRDLLTAYVRQGGTIIVWTGANSARYRGSWVEELMGVELGEDSMYNGAALAEAVFPEPLREGSSPAMQTNATRLIPANEQVTVTGEDFTIATLNPIGQGHVATIAVDAISGILHDCSGFHAVLRDLAALGRENEPLNYALAGQTAVSQLPSVAGVELSPLSSVITYLLLYFFIAIVGNWLFWNWRKRREMAWVCLVFFSFGFTGYAMFFGTQGRARQTELEQFDVYRITPGANMAKHTTFAGLLAQGSGQFSGTLERPDALIADLGTDMMPWQQTGGGFTSAGERPFLFAKSDDAARLENFRIGASEMRVIQIDSFVEIPSGIDGTLTVKEEVITGSLTNNTGLRLRAPELYHEGQFYAVTQIGDQLEINRDRNARRRNQGRNAGNLGQLGVANYYEQRTLPQFQADFYNALFAGKQTTFDGNSFLNPLIGPCIVAWAEDAPLPSINMDTAATENLKGVLVVADIAVDMEAPPPNADTILPVQLSGMGQSHWLTGGTPEMAWNQGRITLMRNSFALAGINVPDFDLAGINCDLVLKVLYPSAAITENSGSVVALYPSTQASNESPMQKTASQPRSVQGVNFTEDTYRITDWKSLRGRSRQLLSAQLRLINENNGTTLSRRDSVEVTMTAHLECASSATAEGARITWR